MLRIAHPATAGLQTQSQTWKTRRHQQEFSRSRGPVTVYCRGKGFSSSSSDHEMSSKSENGASSGHPEVPPLLPSRDPGGSSNGSSRSGGAWGSLQWTDYATPVSSPPIPGEPQAYYFAVASAHSLLGGRPRDVWLVLQPAFLQHPSLQGLRAALSGPTAAIVSTNGQWMMSVVRGMLPQASIGKIYAPTKAIPNPLASLISPEDALGGGGVWH